MIGGMLIGAGIMVVGVFVGAVLVQMGHEANKPNSEDIHLG